MRATELRDKLLAEIDKHLAEENCTHLISSLWSDFEK